MKILYLTHTLNTKTGTGVFSSALIEEVKKKNPFFEISIFTSEDILKNKWSIVRNFFKIRKEISSADIVHALDGFPYGVVAWLANTGIGKPLIVSAIGTGAIQKLRHWFYGKLLRSAYRSARFVVAPSRFIQEELKRGVGIEVEKIVLGVYPEEWQTDAPLIGGIRKPFILSVGSFKKRKGYHVSIPAFAKAIKTNPDLSYVIVANPQQGVAYFNDLKTLIEKEGIENRVKVVSGLARQELLSLYKNAELFVIMSQNVEGDVEGFGLVFLEAASAGIPVIGSKNTGAEDAIADGLNGYVVAQTDVDEVARLIEKIVSDPAERKRLADGSLSFAESMRWETHIARYIELYEKI